ncbi:hypothetical protein KKF61_08740, partial [Patescibacteria group bacterium]|nr:hypothetical protein [Patescibacteria group bacterium]
MWVNGALWDKKTTTDTINYVEFRNADSAVFYALTPTACGSDLTSETNCIQGSLRLKKSGTSIYISKRVPYSWLAQAVYPVEIDPPLDLQVGANADDGFRGLYGSNKLFTSSGGNADAGRYFVSPNQFIYDAFYRFTNVT